MHSVYKATNLQDDGETLWTHQWTQAGAGLSGSLTFNGRGRLVSGLMEPRWFAGLRQSHRTMQRLAAPLGQLPLQRRPPTASGLLPLRRQAFHAQSPRPLAPALTAAASGPPEPAASAAAETSADERKSSSASVSSGVPSAREQAPQAVEAPGVPGFQPPNGERPLWW